MEMGPFWSSQAAMAVSLVGNLTPPDTSTSTLACNGEISSEMDEIDQIDGIYEMDEIG